MDSAVQSESDNKIEPRDETFQSRSAPGLPARLMPRQTKKGLYFSPHGGVQEADSEEREKLP